MRATRFSPLSLTALTYVCTLSITTNAVHAAALREELIEPQKTLESVTNTPISVKTVTGEDFLSFANFDFEDLSRMTAGLTLMPGVTPNIVVRGVNSVSYGDLSLRTNIYLDGALIEQPKALFEQQFDTQRYEILRGPQGTLYGKASPAGTINIRTVDPNMRKIDGYVAASAGQYDAMNTQFGVSLPIIKDQLAVRLAGVYDENEATGQKLITTGQHAQSRSKGGRIIIAWQPTDDFDARLSYNYLERANDSWRNIDGAGYGADDDKVNYDYPSHFSFREQLTILELNKALSDHLSLTSITAYEKQKYPTNVDGDGTPVAAGLVSVNIFADPAWQQDLRLLSEDNPFWDWQVGAFYSRRVGGSTVAITQSVGPLMVNIDTSASAMREEYALYTHNTLKFTDQLNVIVGLRYQQQRSSIDQPLTVTAGPTTLLQGNGIAEDLQRQTDYAVTGTLKVQYFFTPDLVGYVSLDRASRAGGVNTDALGNLPDEFSVIDPETSNSAELGLKGNFWKQRGRFALAVYDQIYKDFQQDMTNLAVASGASREVPALVASAKEAEVRGVEFSLALLPIDNWEVGTSLAFTDAKYNDFDSPCNPAAGQTIPAVPGYLTCDLSGERLPSSSRWSGNISSTYNLPLGDGFNWYAKGLVQTQSSQIDTLTRQTLGGYATADFFTGLRGGSGNTWDVSLWVKNAFDRRAVTSVSQVIPAPLNYQNVTVNLPRQVGITGVYRFQ